jgi:hypothetical protein
LAFSAAREALSTAARTWASACASNSVVRARCSLSELSLARTSARSARNVSARREARSIPSR